jgi:hypothetical protein
VVGNNTYTVVDFNTVDYNPAAVVVNSPFSMVAPSDGYYLVVGSLGFLSSVLAGVTPVFVHIDINGGTASLSAQEFFAGAQDMLLLFHGIVHMLAGQALTVAIVQQSGANQTLEAAGPYTHVSVCKISN